MARLTLSVWGALPFVPFINTGMITEDGTGLPDADSYATVAEADDFHEARGNASWASATDGDKSAALIRATDYIEASYRPIKHRPLNRDQALQWPRECETAVNARVKRATMTLALEAHTQALLFRREREEQQTIEKLDGVGEIRSILDPSPITDFYPWITDMLSGVASRRACGVTISRVRREHDHPTPLGEPFGFGFGTYGIDWTDN